MTDAANAINGIRTHLIVAGREYVRTPDLWIESSRRSPLSRAGLTLPDPTGEELRRLVKGQPVEIRLGYRDRAPSVWRGTIEWTKPGLADEAAVGAVGVERPLATTRVTQAWIEESPEAILRHCVGLTGLPVGRIDSPGVVLPRFVASNHSVWQIAEMLELSCQRAFGLDIHAWALVVDSQGRVTWGDFDEPDQTSVPVVATGGLLIDHAPASDAAGQGVVETWLLPSAWPGQLFRLADARRGLDEQYRILRVRHAVAAQSARTHLWYGVEHGQY